MESITYRLDQFEGPLDLLLTLIQKNKVNIEDIPIAFICDQYMEYIREAQLNDMDIASEFIVMASELMLLKSKMLLPKEEIEEEDPRARFAEAILRYQQIKGAAVIFAQRYPLYSGRIEKDTDEITVDTSFVADQDLSSLALAVRRILANNEDVKHEEKVVFSPMISKPIVPVELKIVGILAHLERETSASLQDLLRDSVSLPDMIAIFLGVLELMKVGQILIESPEDLDETTAVRGIRTRFIINPNPPVREEEKPEEGEPAPEPAQ